MKAALVTSVTDFTLQHLSTDRLCVTVGKVQVQLVFPLKVPGSKYSEPACTRVGPPLSGKQPSLIPYCDMSAVKRFIK